MTPLARGHSLTSFLPDVWLFRGRAYISSDGFALRHVVYPEFGVILGSPRGSG